MWLGHDEIRLSNLYNFVSDHCSGSQKVFLETPLGVVADGAMGKVSATTASKFPEAVPAEIVFESAEGDGFTANELLSLIEALMGDDQDGAAEVKIIVDGEPYWFYRDIYLDVIGEAGNGLFLDCSRIHSRLTPEERKKSFSLENLLGSYEIFRPFLKQARVSYYDERDYPVEADEPSSDEQPVEPDSLPVFDEQEVQENQEEPVQDALLEEPELEAQPDEPEDTDAFEGFDVIIYDEPEEPEKVEEAQKSGEPEKAEEPVRAPEHADLNVPIAIEEPDPIDHHADAQ